MFDFATFLDGDPYSLGRKAKDRLLDLAAAAMRAALLVQEKHAAKEVANA